MPEEQTPAATEEAPGATEEQAPEQEAPPAEGAESAEETSAAEQGNGAQGPDIGDALASLNAAREAFESQQSAEDPLAPLFGQPLDEQDYAEEPVAQEQPQAEADDPAARLETFIQERVDQGINAHETQRELGRRADGIRKLFADTPQMEEHIPAIDARMRQIDPNYGAPGYAPDPAAIEDVYLAIQARAAAQTSQEPEGSQEASAEAGESKGPVLETGAGPGAPPEEMDPVEKAYHQALGGRGNVDPYGFPTG